jgi:hypothetical protein
MPDEKPRHEAGESRGPALHIICAEAEVNEYVRSLAECRLGDYCPLQFKYSNKTYCKAELNPAKYKRPAEDGKA